MVKELLFQWQYEPEMAGVDTQTVTMEGFTHDWTDPLKFGIALSGVGIEPGASPKWAVAGKVRNRRQVTALDF